MKLTEITPTRLEKERRYVRSLYRVYAAARKAYVNCAPETPLLQREELAAQAWEHREQYQRALVKLREFEALPCIKGSHVSLAAKERMIRNGKWKRD